jgi:hypothetical protein
MRPLAEATSRIVSQNCSRKYVALGRILSQWTEVMGSEFADKAQPLKLNYRKNTQSKTPQATLDIATTSSYATILPYQKGLILERINRIFGDQWITDVRFVVTPSGAGEVSKKKIPPAPLTGEGKRYLSDTLGSVEDQEMRIKLENLGKAILTESTS